MLTRLLNSPTLTRLLDYKELDVAKTATPDAIKKAYRNLALELHPDKTKGDKVAEEKFKEVNEFLSDPVKRKTYDQFGANPRQNVAWAERTKPSKTLELSGDCVSPTGRA